MMKIPDNGIRQCRTAELSHLQHHCGWSLVQCYWEICESNYSSQEMKNIFKAGAFAVALFYLASSVAGSSVGMRPFVMCSHDARRFLAWFCENSAFEFPFEFSREHIVKRYRLPDPKLYPFQNQAGNCCKRGCYEHELHKMCSYRIWYSHCDARSKAASGVARYGMRANCLTRHERAERGKGVRRHGRHRRILEGERR